MKIYIFLLSLLVPASLLAQSNYQPAYVTKNGGDTLKGYINYRDWSTSPKTIDFKTNKDDPRPEHFSAADIKGFSVNGMDTYVGYIGVVSMDKNKFPDLPPDIDTTKRLDTVFLRQLVTGNNITLYSNSDNLKIRYFIAETGKAPLELKDYEYYNNYRQIVSTPVYKGQLTIYADKFAPENERLKNLILSCNFDLNDLTRVRELLNGTTSAISNKKSANRLFVGVAANIVKTQVNNLPIFPTFASGSSTAVGPQVSIGYDIFDNPNVQHFAFRVEAAFSLISPELKFPGQVDNINTYQYYKFTQFTSAIIPQFLINLYNKPAFKIFIAGGISFNISTYPADKTSIQSDDPTVVQAYTKQNPYQYRSVWVSAPIQAGVTVNKNLQFFAIYNVVVESYAPYNDSGSHSAGVGLRYLFGNK